MLPHIALLLAAVAFNGGAPASGPPTPPPLDVESYPVWRAQLTVLVCSPAVSWNSGTDNDVRVKLNSANSTWLDYSRDDFEIGSEFTYDLKLNGVSRFSDVTQLRISKTGTDGLCLKKIVLHLNDSAVFTKTWASGRWLDGSVLDIPSAELRGASWNAYVAPTSADFRFGNAELESRIESVTGDALRTPGEEKLHWQQSPGEDVKLLHVDSRTAMVDLDLRADVSGWPDQNVDVDFRLNLSCMLGKPRMTTSQFKAEADLGPITGPLVWIIELLQDIGLEGVAATFAINPVLGGITSIASIIAHALPDLPTGGGPPPVSISLPEAAPLCPELFQFERGAHDNGIFFKTSLHMAWSPTQLRLMREAMTCVAPPTADVTPPGATLIVEYREPDGDHKRKVVKVGDPDVTVTASRHHAIGVTYIGEDPEGVRKAHLDYDMNTGGLLLAINTTSLCPRQALIGTQRFEAGTASIYEFAARAENWLGGSRTTGKVTVKTQ